MRKGVVAVVVAGAAAATACAVWLGRGSDSSSPRSVERVAVTAPAPVAAPSDPRGRLAGLRFLERNADGTVAVIDDAVAKQSYFSKVGDLVLGARVQAITEAAVTLADEKLGVITLPYRGRADSDIEVRRPFEARAGYVPVHVAPSVSPEQVAADQAIVDEYLRTLPSGPGRGGGGGGGRGRNRDSAPASREQGGRGRQRHRAEREAKEAAAAKAREAAGSASDD